jgi:hypothetical protein
MSPSLVAAPTIVVRIATATVLTGRKPGRDDGTYCCDDRRDHFGHRELRAPHVW